MKKLSLTLTVLFTIAVAVFAAKSYYKYSATCNCGRSVVVTLDGGDYNGVMSRSSKCSCGKYVTVTYHWKQGQPSPSIEKVECK